MMRTPIFSPGAPEILDGLDNDCNGDVDEGIQVWYLDVDGDGFGTPGATLEAIQQPENYVLSGDDCDDENAGIYPGAPETLDGIDNDCDGLIDEGLDLDFGDAPNGGVATTPSGYPTTTDENGARHTTVGPRLGS